MMETSFVCQLFEIFPKSLCVNILKGSLIAESEDLI